MRTSGRGRLVQMKRAAATSLVLLLTVSACEGSGSDIGPDIEPPLPNSDYRVLVHDDQGRGVSAALVSVSGIASPTPTGRSGRADVQSVPTGMRLITVDGANASATDTDMLGTLTISAATPDGNQLPYVLNIPDVSQSVGLALNTGVQAVQSTLDDSATSGVIATVPAGTNVTFGTAPTVTLRSGSLQSGHLPGDLPTAPPGARLMGQGAYLAPDGVTFAPGIDLSLPNDLQLAGGAMADLFFLNPATGSWENRGTGTVAGARIVATDPTGAVTQGGLYAFSTTIAQTAGVMGRVIDPDGSAIGGVLVRAGEGQTRTDSNGNFTISDLAAELGDASPRSVTVEFTGGRDLRPSSTSQVAALAGGTVADLGDIVLDTFSVADVRLMLITRGRQDTEKRMGISANLGPTSSLGIGDCRAQATFEDQEIGQFGWLTSSARNTDTVFLSQGLADLSADRLTLDLRIFSSEVGWTRDPGSGTSAFVVDSLGTGPISGAAVTRGFPPSVQFVGFTNNSGGITLSIGSPDQITAYESTTSGPVTVISAFAMVDPASGRVEIPLERAPAPPVGNFDRNGLVSGDMIGGGSPERRIRSTRILDRNDWYDSVFLGRNVEGDVPIKVDPALTGGTAFTVGVTATEGNLSGVEGTSSGGDFSLDRMGIQEGLAVQQGDRLLMDLPLNNVANTPFLADNALNNLDPSIPLADLEFDLALAQDDLTVDVVRGVGGNMAFNGLDATFTLPSLGGFPAGSEYLLRFGGTSSNAGTTIDQRTVLTLDASTEAGTPGPVVQFMDVPAITSPAPGATVPASGFTVSYTIPISTLYLVVELRSELPTDTRVWTAVLPASISSFEFYTPPASAPNPLEAGRTWTLTVTAARVENGPIFGFTNSYVRMVTNFVGISAAERVVNAFSSSSITITTN